MKDKISILFPKNYPITDSVIKSLRNKNEHLSITKGTGNNIILAGNNFSIEQTRLFSLNITEFNEQLYETTSKLNKKKQFGIQYAGNLIFIEMGTFGLISALTAAIIVGLGIWLQKNNSGRIYTEEGEYQLPDPDDKTKTVRIKPDMSFIDFKDADEDTQDKWISSFINKPPTLAIEIVSSKYALKATQQKMKQYWMRCGAKVGIVINPFEKKYYVYEKNKSKPTAKSIYVVFTHPLFPEYEGDFSKYADKF